MKEYEIVIVGAGPAGLRCAEILAKNKRKVLVLEKNKVIGDKVCAGGITRKIIDLVPDNILQRKFKKIIFHTPLQDAEIKQEKPFIATILRRDLGNWQAKQARKAGTKILLNSEVTKIDKNIIIINNKEKVEYKYLVGADGHNSIVRKYLNLKIENFGQAFQYITKKKFNNLEVFIDPEKYGSFYLWIFPYKTSSSIGAGEDLSKKIKQPVLNLKLSEIKSNLDNFCKKRLEINKAKFQACMINYDYKGYQFNNIFLCGEAAGFVSGLTGEGICWAIKSGEDIANKIINEEYKCKNIKHILRIKELEENFMRTLEINKKMTEVEWEMFNFLLKIKWLGDKFIEDVD